MIHFKLQVADSLLLNPSFEAKIKSFITQCASNREVLLSVSNFISRKPEKFAEHEVIETLLKHIRNRVSQSLVLKCLALIMSCMKGLRLLHEVDLSPLITPILLNRPQEEELTTYAIMAFKNFMISQNSFENLPVQWETFVKLFVESAYTKTNILLQQVSIQALRVMSDKPEVKKQQCKVYKSKIFSIPCISEESRKLKYDLLQWIDYRNYRPSLSQKYSKLFIQTF